ncbi:hypothetical protein [Paraburkholderia humisilvae]|uniref:Uncharacterized protein n=1 Tax=Paraburkholderia humisilvae TaxID=627669 RepID=A0A6J5EF59_9BURK|nr:hypothetical protein [Paraburkholderia humisilvae]CAB3764387.1 hypothetical protein LMG29542_04882 [Paraburkholderia humisilvae]
MSSSPINTRDPLNAGPGSSSTPHEAAPAAETSNLPSPRSVIRPLAGLRVRGEQLPGSGDSAQHAGKSAPEMFHVHEMWDRPTLNRVSAGSDAKFREGLATAYLTLVDGISDSKANVDAHLWTEQTSLHALYRNDSEVEIPHSMLARAPVTVHLKGEIPALVDKFPADFRKAITSLYNHPAGENIGARADINRAIYTGLYKQSAMAKELNVHIDTDTLAATRILAKSPSAAKAIGNDTVLFSDVSNRENQMKRLKSIQKQLNQIKLSEEPKPLTKEDVARLADMPQKSWSGQKSSSYGPTRQGVSAEEQENIDQLRKLGFSSHAVTPDESENDVLVVSPFSRDSGIVLSRMAQNLDNNRPLNLQSAWGQIGIQPWTKYLMELNRDPRAGETAMKKSDILDYFNLAEKIRKNGPAIDAKINALNERIQNSPIGSKERADAEHELGALRYIKFGCNTLVESFVNENTFFPQIRDATSAHMEAVDKLTSKTLFGARAPSIVSNSWHDNEESVLMSYSSSDEVARRVFAELKGMIRASTAEDRY